MAQAVTRGVKQYVVLGAGLDTFAYRNPFAALQIFEVDYPATQAWKRERLEAAGIAIPATLTFAPVDSPLQRSAKLQMGDRKSTRLNSSHQIISYAVFCL